MLNHLIFIIVFLTSFVISLAFAQEVVFAVFGDGGIFKLPWGQFGRLQGIIYSSVIFVMISGFIPIYTALYVIYMRKISRLNRQIMTVLVYFLACTILWFFFGSKPTPTEGLLIVLGIFGILASDFLAEKIASKKGIKGDGGH